MDLVSPVPPNEEARLTRVHQLCALDSSSDDTLNQIVDLLAERLQVPVAVVSIVERGRQRFRAKTGLEVDEIARRGSFCAYAILGDDLFEVVDTTRDARFRDHPLVTGGPGIRFYAGMPLMTDDGLGLGTLCVLDNRPRPPLAEDDRKLLAALARLVVGRLQDLRRMHFVHGPTGLFNRARLEEDVQSLLGEAGRALLVVVDVVSPAFYDAFIKALGHRFDDALMLGVKARLEGLLPERCPLYRISTTRLAFVLRQEQEAQAPDLFGRIVADFEAPVLVERIPLYAQLGLGVLTVEAGQRMDEDWLRSAIGAADAAREQGRGWAWYDAQQDASQQRSFALLSHLAEAVRVPDQLRLVYQPRVDLASGACVAVEALLRWRHPSLGEVSPGEFIPLAERTSLIRPLSLWVLAAAVAQAARWREQGLALTVSINVSANDLEDAQFGDQLAAELQRHALRAEALELELTEGALMRNPAVVRQQLARLRSLGVAVAIDDFGAGYSNWAYLRELPADTVKLDQSFLLALDEGDTNRRIAGAMVELALDLGYRVVAEGIETAEAQALVQQWGCHEGQGFHIARPMAAEALAAWLAAR